MTASRRAIVIIVSVIAAAAIVVGLSFAFSSVGGGKPGASASPSASAGATGEPTTGPSGSAGSSQAPTSGATSGSTGGSGSGTGAGGSSGGSGSTSAVTAAPGTASGKAHQPVALDKPAVVVPKVTVSLADVAGVTGKSGGVGEISGPAMKFTVVFDNATSSTVDLSTTVVTVTYGASDTPSNEIVTARKALPQSVKAGAKAEGTYTFTIPKTDRANTRVTVDYSSSAPSVVFAGTAPAGS